MAYASESGLFRIAGLPDEFDIGAQWFYQIQAVAPDPSTATKTDLQQMLRSLLSSRFNLKVHRETREVDGFHLMVAKGGVKFRETSLDEEPIGVGPGPAGITQRMIKGRYGMKQLAAQIANEERPVIDKTDLPGVYDITLLIDLVPGTGGGERGRVGRPEPPTPATPLTNLLEEQLGLRLERARVPVEFLVIDHIEKATEN
jgi:uncharacterized protein (TIGR03435 family)